MKTLTAVLFFAALSLRADVIQNTFVPEPDPLERASSGTCSTVASSGPGEDCGDTAGVADISNAGDHSPDDHDGFHGDDHGYHGEHHPLMPTSAPEPTTWMMAGTGIILVLHSMRRR